MANITSDNRRKFSRIPFHAQAHIHADKGDFYLNCDVIDVSLNGILIAEPMGWDGQLTDKYEIDLVLEGAQLVIKMSATVAHINNGVIGFTLKKIGVESIGQLKRLMELNLADEALLHRELASLIQ